ncbi:hypothetical protein HYQ45_015014 [Verticillium longisporum]|uniref:Uncharacterized protein n=1 Tax=Verticillium longisporum TaxID=100787 RepID=A0A8I2Z8R2_VERLO|nr:hypothetical protein HYQ45_015014 [Verticillium longisporum]
MRSEDSPDVLHQVPSQKALRKVSVTGKPQNRGPRGDLDPWATVRFCVRADSRGHACARVPELSLVGCTLYRAWAMQR